MPGSGRTAATLAALGAILALAAVWGWRAATEPLPGKVDTPVCVGTEVEAGSKVYPQQVTVSVFNAGQRAGLAGRTMRLLTDRGFAEGNEGNARSGRVSTVEIWTDDPQSPAVQLVARQLGPRVDIEQRAALGPGVNVVVGDQFAGLVKGRKAVVATEDTEICSPPVS